MVFYPREKNSVGVVLFLIIIFGFTSALQSHEGSAPTNEFTLDESSPNARIKIDNSNTIVIVNVDPPRIVEPGVSPYKVSLELMSMQLCDPTANDRLKIVHSDPTSIKTDIWKVNVTTSTRSSSHELKDIQANQIVLIPEGRWVRSSVIIVATLYQDLSEDGSCPNNTFPCICHPFPNPRPVKSLSEELPEFHPQLKRCISWKLACNNIPNCGIGCLNEESQPFCPSFGSDILALHALPSCDATTTSSPPEPEETSVLESTGGTAPTIASAAIILKLMILMLYTS